MSQFAALSVVSGSIGRMPVAAARKVDTTLVSHTGVPLTRAPTFRFTLDPNREQEQLLLAHAGAARLAYNHHLGRVRANLDQRAAARSYGIAEADLTLALSWSKVSFVNHMNVWKARPRADRWFPSSKTCSGCGTIDAGLTLADRVFDCDPSLDRDVDAASTSPATQHLRRLHRHNPWPPDARPASAPGWAGPRADLHLAPRRGPGPEPGQDHPATPGGGWTATKNPHPRQVRVKGSR